MDLTKDSLPHGNHPAPPLPLPSPLLCPGVDQAASSAPFLFSSIPQHPAVWDVRDWGPVISDLREAQWPQTDPCPPLPEDWGPGFNGFPQQDTHLGLRGEHRAVLHVCLSRAPKLWWDTGSLSPFYSLTPASHMCNMCRQFPEKSRIGKLWATLCVSLGKKCIIYKSRFILQSPILNRAILRAMFHALM
jgi:hypothetical protein